MNSIQVLDCTLRDGGYCNEWNFGYENIKKIITGLGDANIDIIECGFISNRASGNKDESRFRNFEEIKSIIPAEKNGKLFVAMINLGEFSIEDIPPFDVASIDGIRLAFHKKDLKEALDACKMIKSKGYLLFVQAMVSLNYSDSEFLSLLECADDIKPYAFYIVDSFGVMREKELVRLFHLAEHNLSREIRIGFHSHNNMQLSYSNAQKLTKMETDSNLIIDSSIYGMGRGAGNLNTELFIEYLNDNAGKSYCIKPILNLIDEILNEFYLRNYWGYSLPNYISASHNAHPNYANYLDEKKTLTIEAIDDIFDMMDDDKKVYYDKNYIEKLYEKYMESGKSINGYDHTLRERLFGRNVLLIAPGKSSVEEKNTIISFVQGNDNLTVISVNHKYTFVETDYVFVSNLRRYRELNDTSCKQIVTSNIPASGECYKTSYKDLINDVEGVADNAGLMAIKLLIMNKSKHVYLAGFDGYTHDINQNYGLKNMEIVSKYSYLDAINAGMSTVIKKMRMQIPIDFITNTRLIGIDD